MKYFQSAIFVLLAAEVYAFVNPSQSPLNSISDDIFFEKIKMMQPKKNNLFHDKNDLDDSIEPAGQEGWSNVLKNNGPASGVINSEENHSRVKRKAKRRKLRTKKPVVRSHKDNEITADAKYKYSYSLEQNKNNESEEVDHAAGQNPAIARVGRVEMPKDLYAVHLRPSVIFRVHMAEAILKMQYRNYAEDKDESVIEADVEYLRLTRKVLVDELSKFDDFRWQLHFFLNKSALEVNHTCNLRYTSVGRPNTIFTSPEEDIKRNCIFDNVYLDKVPYVVGDDRSLMAAVAPPVLHCDAAMCTSVPFVDRLMGETQLPHSDAQRTSPCELSCIAACKNNLDCLLKCEDMCE